MTIRPIDQPYFSVVISAYNDVSGLRRCLASVSKQAFRNFEVVVVDDGSTVDIEGVVAEFMDPRFTYIWQENSGGPAKPRNTGIDHSKGRWICFLDHDDVWHPDKLQRVFVAAESASLVDMIVHDEFVLDENGTVQGRIGTGALEPDFARRMLYLGNPFSTSAVSVRRKFLQDQDLRFSEDPVIATAEDFDLWLAMSNFDPQILSLNEVLGAYFAGTGISSDLERHLKARHAVILRHSMDRATGRPWTGAQMRPVRAGLHLDLARVSRVQGSHAAVFRHIVGALLLSPSAFRARVLGSGGTHRVPDSIEGTRPTWWD